MEKQQVFYIHGGNAYTTYEAYLTDLRQKTIRNLPGMEVMSRWPNTFEAELGDEYEIFKPSMPNKQSAKYKEWKIWFERHFEYLRDDVIMIGESLGAYFLAKYFVENQTPFRGKALFLMAAPFENIEPNELGTEDGGDFSFDTSHTSMIGQRVDQVYIVHSKDDFVVPYEHALKYQAALPEATLLTFEDKNHFLIEEFPELFEKIRAISASA